MTHTQKDLRLLPNSYKKIAWGLLVISILVAVLTITKLLPLDKGLMKIHIQSGILISLLILALSKDKIEDEMTLKLRLAALASAFLFGITMTIVEPYINLMLGGDLFYDKGAFQLILGMILMYFIVFYIVKSQR